MSKPKNIQPIFHDRPAQYGLRGDPHLWAELEEAFADISTPDSESALHEILLQTIQLSIGQELQAGKNFFIQKYSKGGMSSGKVCSDFWLEKGIPLLIGRYALMKQSW